MCFFLIDSFISPKWHTNATATFFIVSLKKYNWKCLKLQIQRVTSRKTPSYEWKKNPFFWISRCDKHRRQCALNVNFYLCNISTSTVNRLNVSVIIVTVSITAWCFLETALKFQVSLSNQSSMFDFINYPSISWSDNWNADLST